MTLLPSARSLPAYGEISRALPYLAPVVAVCGTALPALLGLPSLTIVSLYATVPTLVVSAAYFATSGAIDLATPTAEQLSDRAVELSVTLYFTLFGVAILLASAGQVRPMSFYLLVGVLATVVLSQCLWAALTPSRVALILCETSGLLLGVVWSVSLKYHYFFGRTDVFPHHRLIEGLLSSHRVTSVFGAYQPFPLWHVFVGFQTMLYDSAFGPLTLSFVLTGLLFATAPPAVYALARRFQFPRRTALVAGLGTALNPFVVLYGMYSIPRSITSLLVPFCLLLLLVEDRRASVLYAGLLVGVAVYHTISLPYIFVTVGCYFAVERFLTLSGRRADGPAFPVVPRWAVLAIPVVQLSYWAVAAPDLVARVVGLAAGPPTSGDGGGAVATPFIELPVHELVNYVPYGLIVFFVLFGVVQSTRLRRLSSRSKALLLTALLVTAVSVPGPALLVSVVSSVTSDMAFRAGQYTYPFVAIAFAVGVVSMVSTVGRRRVGAALVCLLVFSTAFFAVSNDFVASDNPVTERADFYNFYLSEQETTSYATIAGHTDSAITSDYVTCRYVNNPGSGRCDIIQADPVAGRLHDPPDSVVVVRSDELRERPLSVYPTPEPVENPPYSNTRDSLSRQSPVWDDLGTYNRVYDSTDVSGYTTG